MIDQKSVHHLLEKFGDHREMFADYILPTILASDEIRLYKHKGKEWRLRFLKAWDNGKKVRVTMAVATEVNGKYRLLTFMPKNLNALAKQRKGTVLVWRKPPVEEEK